MIVFDLICRSRSHVFEAWFASSRAYEQQRAAGLIACPLCGDSDVGKSIMAPNVSSKGNRRSEKGSGGQAVSERGDAGAVSMQNVPDMSPEMQKAIAQLAKAQKKMLEKSRWVGRDFAERARAIHYGEADVEIIHGEATCEQAQDLLEEGVAVAPLPFPHVPPEQQN